MIRKVLIGKTAVTVTFACLFVFVSITYSNTYEICLLMVYNCIPLYFIRVTSYDFTFYIVCLIVSCCSFFLFCFWGGNFWSGYNYCDLLVYCLFIYYSPMRLVF